MDTCCRPSVNAVECSGCGGCADMFPHIFGWDDLASRPTVKDGPFSCEEVRQAMALCPRDCIEAVDEDSKPRKTGRLEIPAASRDGWDARKEAVARWYDRRAKEFAAKTAELDMAVAYGRFLAGIPEGGSILDAGCGAGRDSAYFLARGYAVTAFDLSPEMARLARERTGLDVKVLDLAEARWAQEFHGVWAVSSLLHLPRAAAGPALARLGRALAPGGALLASGKHGDREWEKDGLWFTALDQAWLEDFLAANPGLRLREAWRRPDDRPGRGREEWFAFLLERAAD